MPTRPSVPSVAQEKASTGLRASAGRWLRRAALPLVGMVLLSTVAGSGTAWWLADSNQQALSRDTARLVDRIQKRFSDYAQVDVGVRSFRVVHQPLGHEDLAMYVAGLDLPNRYPGLQTVSVSELVPPGPGADQQFDAQQRQAWLAYSHGQVTFGRHDTTVISPSAVRTFLDDGPDIGQEVVTYLEPWQGFPGGVGRVLTGDPSMVAALKMGRDQNVAATGNVLMAHGVRGDSFPAMSIRLPLFNGPSGSVEERRRNYAGSVGVGIRLDQFFNRVLVDNDLQYLDMQVFTTPVENGSSGTLKRWVVYDSRRRSPNAPFSLVQGRWSQTVPLNMGGYRVWALFANNRLPDTALSPLWSLIVGLLTFGGLFAAWVLADSSAEARRRAVTIAAIATRDLEKQQALIEQAAQMAGVGHWQLDVTGNRLMLSGKAEEILGFSATSMHPKAWAARLDPGDVERWKRWFNELSGTLDHQDKRLDYRYRRAQEVLWISIVGRRVDQGRGSVTLQGSLIDISQRKRDEMELRIKHRLGSIATSGAEDETPDDPGQAGDDLPLRTLFDQQRLFDSFIQRLCDELGQPAGVVWLYDPAQERFERVGCWADATVEPPADSTWVWKDHPWNRAGALDRPDSPVVVEDRRDRRFPVRLDWPVRSAGKPLAWIEMYGTQVREALVYDLRDPPIQHAIWQEALQLTRYHAHYTRLNYLAGTDPLTALMSRYRFSETLRERLKTPKTGYGVLFIDLDGFKKVNDSRGHAAGDQVLQDMAKRFMACLGPDDAIGRMGGDEFAVLTPTPLLPGPVPHADDRPVMDLAARLLAASERPFHLGGATCFLGASIGIVLSPDDGAVAVDLIKRADIAMYTVKKNSKNGYRRYATDLETAVLLRNEIETALRAAPLNNEMTVVFQPKFQLDDQGCPLQVGVESLLRWHHPTLGNISPDAFIAIAEDNGDIHALGQWVMQNVTRQMVQWDRMAGPPVRAAVNLSPRQFMDEAALNACLEWVDRAGLDPHRITLEITEGCLMESPTRSQVLLQTLHERGFRIAIDDFGMGYSSLAYLKTFHVDEIKIDKSFVQNMGYSPQDVAIVDAILNMARSMGMDVVAEGVETVEQLRTLQRMGCRIFQGFLFSKPLDPDALMALLAHPMPSLPPAPPG